MFVLKFMFFATISCRILWSLNNNCDDFELMVYTKLISEEHFAVGHPVVIVLPHGEQSSSNNAVFYLIKKLHSSARWPMIVFNARYEMEANMLIETHKHGSYIILISGPCQVWEEHISGFRQQLSILRFGNTWESWNPQAKFLVSVMSDCPHFETTLISRAILKEFWSHGVVKAIVLFKKSSEGRGKMSEKNTSHSTQVTHMEIQTWFPYENSQRCDPAEGIVPVKVFTIRNFNDIKGNDIFKGHFLKNLHGCPIRVFARIYQPFVNPPKRFWLNDSYYYVSYEDGLEIELIRIIGKSVNGSLVIVDGNNTQYRNGTPCIYIGGYNALISEKGYKFTRSYVSVRFVWYTPCAVKHARWSRFFKIFSSDVWIALVLSVVSAVFIVRCISKCAHKLNLQETKTYSNILSITTNIIAVLLFVTVNMHPRTAPLRVFFFCWVCYSVAISTVFQAYLTSYLVEPGYEEPIKTLNEMLKSERKFGFVEGFEILYANKNSNSVDLAVLKDAVHCPDYDACFKWAAIYYNISTIINDFRMEGYRKIRNWTDAKNRPLLCELEDGLFGKLGVVFFVNEENPLLEYINDAIGHIVEGGIFMQLKERYFTKENFDSGFDSYTFDYASFAYNIKQLQTVFYLLLMGYLLALAFFIIEVLRHYFRSKRHERKRTLSHGQT